MVDKIVTAELQIVALGQSDDSQSRYISSAVKALEEKGVHYQLTPMGTDIQANSIDEIFDAYKQAHQAIMDMGVNRVVTHMTIDHRLKG